MAWLAPWSAILPSLAALAVFDASAWACLLCFTSYEERLQICQIFAGLDSPDLGKCEEAFEDAFKGLLDTEINYEERGQLNDAFTQMTHSLQEMAAAQGSFRVAFLHAAEKMQKIILQLKEVQACIPPCGLQEVTRRFRCRGCYSKVCDLPLDCPVQDLTVTRGRQAMFSCTVNFQLPKEEITYSWKFAGGVSRGGTSVKGFRRRRESLLRSGRGWEVLRWVPQEAETIEPWRPSLGELLATPGALTPGNQCLLAALVALASASVTVLAWMFFRWYCSGN
nr:sperm acrosome membrane-associated protein 6 [Odocoileus virginianus texanus]